jgi:hypothetical protein
MVPCHLVLVISDHTRVRTFCVDGAVGLRLRAAAGIAGDGKVGAGVVAVERRDWWCVRWGVV